MSDSIQIRQGTTTQRTSETLVAGVLVWDTTTQQLYCHNGTTAGGVLIGAPVSTGSTETNGYSTPTAISAAGTTTLTLGSTDLRKTFNVTVNGGAGVYTASVVLDTTNANTGDIAVLMLALPASTNPTIDIRNATAGGTLLDRIHDDQGSEALYWLGEYVYTGSAWIKVRSGFQEA